MFRELKKFMSITEGYGGIFFICIFLLIAIVSYKNTMYISDEFKDMKYRIAQLQDDLEQTKKLQFDSIIAILQLHPSDNPYSKELLNTYRNNKIFEDTIKVPELKPKKPDNITPESNLSMNTSITAEDMNRIIDFWNAHVKGGTPFQGKGEAFIQASTESGLDPVYILAHAAWESGWGKSYIAVEKHNYFGIAAYDRSPYESAYTMGDCVDKGIVEGAKWIKSNYYDQGYTNLSAMINLGNYASDKAHWIKGIISIMKTSYSII